MNRILKNQGFTVAAVIAVLVSFLLTFDWQSPNAQDLNNRADGVEEKHKHEDPCDKLLDVRGRAEGHQRKCRRGSSSGISRGDFNGDGFADLAVGAPGKNSPASVESSGAVYVIYGSASGLLPGGGNGIPATQFWAQNTQGIPGTSEEDDHFGSALAAGEFNGDGFSDLAIGIDGEDTGGLSDVGRVVVIYGSAAGLTATDPNVLSAQSFEFLNVRGSAEDDNVGAALAWGDFDGDTVGDLAIGAPGTEVFHETGPSTASLVSEAGVVWILRGSQPNGLTVANSDRVTLVSQNTGGTPDAAPMVPNANDHFGEVLTGGDFNGDGFTDLAVGTPDEDLRSIRDVGVVQVFFGRIESRSGDFDFGFPVVLSLADFSLNGQPDDEFGASLAAGDFDLDGRKDLAIGVPKRDAAGGEDAGMVCLTRSIQPNRVLTQSDLLTNASETFDKFGSALAAGDFNGDSISDLAVGVPFEDVVANGQTVNNAGEVNVVYGSGQGLRIGAGLGQRFTQGTLGSLPEEDDRFGTSLSAWNFGRNQTLRDITGQPFIFRTTDLAIGVPFEDLFTEDGIEHLDAGAIHVLYGGLSGLTTANNQFLHQANIGGFSNVSFDRFGRFLY